MSKQAKEPTHGSKPHQQGQATRQERKKDTPSCKPQSYLGFHSTTRPPQQRVGDAEQQSVSPQVGLSHANAPHAPAFSPTLGCPHLLARCGRASSLAYCNTSAWCQLTGHAYMTCIHHDNTDYSRQHYSSRAGYYRTASGVLRDKLLRTAGE